MKAPDGFREDFDLVDLERLNAFKSAVVRCRWFLLVTTFISGVVLVNAYLQEFSAHESALKETLKRRYKSATEVSASSDSEETTSTTEAAPDSPKGSSAGRTEPDEDRLLSLGPGYKIDDILIELDEALRAEDANRDEVLDEFAEIVLARIATQNSLNEIRHGERPLPLLGMEIPAYDFLPIMSGMLIIFFLGTWLNVRSLTAIFDFYPLRENRTLLELIMLNFTFTGIWGSQRDRKVAEAVQALSFCLPAIAMAVAIVVDALPILRILAKRWDAGEVPPLESVVGPLEMVFGRILLELVAAAVVLGISVSSISKVNAIDKHILSIMSIDGPNLSEQDEGQLVPSSSAEPEPPEDGEDVASEA